MSEDVVRAQFQAPACVQAWTTTRLGPGVSTAPFDRFNLGDHVGDDPAAVAHNRAALRSVLSLPSEPFWLRQVHGMTVVDADALSTLDQLRRSETGLPLPPTADAAITRTPGRVLAILTADCLPVLFTADDGSVIGAAHAGWRGLAAGVLEVTVAAMGHPPQRISAWIGPGIRQPAFEVGAEVRDIFLAQASEAGAAFAPAARPDHFLCDLALLARQRLARAGVQRVDDCGLCTHADAQRFYSHRRDQRSGRLASLIWIEHGR